MKLLGECFVAPRVPLRRHCRPSRRLTCLQPASRAGLTPSPTCRPGQGGAAQAGCGRHGKQAGPSTRQPSAGTTEEGFMFSELSNHFSPDPDLTFSHCGLGQTAYRTTHTSLSPLASAAGNMIAVPGRFVEFV